MYLQSFSFVLFIENYFKFSFLICDIFQLAFRLYHLNLKVFFVFHNLMDLLLSSLLTPGSLISTLKFRKVLIW